MLNAVVWPTWISSHRISRNKIKNTPCILTTQFVSNIKLGLINSLKNLWWLFHVKAISKYKKSWNSYSKHDVISSLHPIRWTPKVKVTWSVLECGGFYLASRRWHKQHNRCGLRAINSPLAFMSRIKHPWGPTTRISAMCDQDMISSPDRPLGGAHKEETGCSSN